MNEPFLLGPVRLEVLAENVGLRFTHDRVSKVSTVHSASGELLYSSQYLDLVHGWLCQRVEEDKVKRASQGARVQFKQTYEKFNTPTE